MMIFCPGCHKKTPSEAQCRHCGRVTTLNGRWVLEQMVGHGASGYTWRARDPSSGEVAAIKELSFRRLTDLKQIELFEREVQALESIHHPGIPEFIEQFTVEEDRFVSAYLVQEFIDGSVIDLNKRRTEEEILEFLKEMANLLEVLHSMRPPVIHRDIKPSNVMRRKDGRYVLIDFGAIRASTEKSMGGSTMAGTPGYMAPEQLTGKAEPASDFYGLGATAVAMLAGKDAHDLIDSHEPMKWREKVLVSDSLASILQAMLQPKSGARIDSSKALRSAIQNATKSQQPVGDTVRKVGPFLLGGLSIILAVLSFQMVNGQNVAFALKSLTMYELYYGVSLIVIVSGGTAFALLWFLSGLWTSGLKRNGVPLLFSPIIVLLAVLSELGPLPISEDDMFWVGEREGEFRVAVIGPTKNILEQRFQVVTYAIPESRILASTPVKGDCKATVGPERCPVIWYSVGGGGWFVQASDSAMRVDLWNGQVTHDLSTEIQAVFRPKSLEGEKLRVEFSDGSTGVFGPEHSPKSIQWGVLRTIRDSVSWAHVEDIDSHRKLFRQRMFFKDDRCGLLVHHNQMKEGFGEGVELLSAVDRQGINWTRPIQNIVGKDEFVGAIGGTSKCFLVSKSSSKLNFYTWNPETGATELFFSLKHKKPVDLSGSDIVM